MIDEPYWLEVRLTKNSELLGWLADFDGRNIEFQGINLRDRSGTQKAFNVGSMQVAIASEELLLTPNSEEDMRELKGVPYYAEGYDRMLHMDRIFRWKVLAVSTLEDAEWLFDLETFEPA